MQVLKVAGEVYEAQSLLRQQAQLTEIRLRLEQQLLQLQLTRGPDPAIAARLQRISQSLKEDEALHRAFLDSLKESNLSRQAVTQEALTRADTLAPRSGAQVALGTIVDPQSDLDFLSHIPGLNPDFVAAVRRERELLLSGDVVGAGMVNKNPNGSYITAFGPSRGSTQPPSSPRNAPTPRGLSTPNRSPLPPTDACELLPNGCACCNTSCSIQCCPPCRSCGGCSR